MKALSVVEKAGKLISTGTKTLEIRSWEADGLPLLDLAIVQNSRRLTKDDPVDADGQIVAVVNVRKIRKWKKEDAEASCSIWEDGWLAWELANIRQVIDGPKIPAKRRIYEIRTDLSDLKLLAPRQS